MGESQEMDIGYVANLARIDAEMAAVDEDTTGQLEAIERGEFLTSEPPSL